MKTNKSDCDVLITEIEDVFSGLGNCFDTAFDDKKTKMNVIGSIYGFGKSLTKLVFNTTGCAIKNAPKAVVAVASAKREVVTAIEDEWSQYKKEQKEEALSEKIKLLRLKA